MRNYLSEISFVQGDITKSNCDAIVNAANNSLLGGGGVDGAIHRGAGPELLLKTKTMGGCRTGEAKITLGYNLPAKYIIHTVGPVWQGGTHNEAHLLKSCYLSSLELAREHDINSLAFPAISTGVYGFPKLEAARIALTTVVEYTGKNNVPSKIVFYCFSEDDLNIYKTEYEKL